MRFYQANSMTITSGQYGPEELQMSRAMASGDQLKNEYSFGTMELNSAHKIQFQNPN